MDASVEGAGGGVEGSDVAGSPAAAATAEGDEAITDTTGAGLSSSRLSAAFGAALGAVDDEADVPATGSDLTAGIPGVNQGTPLAAGGPGVDTLPAEGVDAGRVKVTHCIVAGGSLWFLRLLIKFSSTGGLVGWRDERKGKGGRWVSSEVWRFGAVSVLVVTYKVFFF